MNSNIHHNIQQFFMGHTGDIEMAYTLRKNLPIDQIEEMRNKVNEVVEPWLGTKGKGHMNNIVSDFEKRIEETQQKEKEKDKQLATLQRFASFQIHIFTQHSGRPSKKCELCRKAMGKLSLMSLG